MTQLPLQGVATVFELSKKLPQFRVIYRTLFLVSDQILLADIGDIARLPVLCEQVIEGLILRGADVFRNGVVPFFAVRKDGVDIEYDAPEWEDFMADNRANAKSGMRNGRGFNVMSLLVGMCHEIKFSASGKNRKAALALDSPLG